MTERVNKKNNAWDKVKKARMLERPTAKAFIDKLFDHFIEFHGDRCYGDDPAIIGGIALFDGKPVTVIGEQKGENTKDNIYRNFGMPHPEGYRKSLRLMRQAEKFNRPVICFVDTQGAYCGVGAEERGQGEAIAKNLISLMNLKVPVIAIVIGEGGSGGALALAVGDEVWMLENSIYSILSPEGFASILWKEPSRAQEAAEIMKITAEDLLELGIIEKIIDEPKEGLEKNIEPTIAELRNNIKMTLERLSNMDIDELLNKRYERFRKIGEFIE